MPNPLFSRFGGNNQNGSPLGNLVSQFNLFRSNFQGDPQQKVQELLNSGQMTQEQFNQLSGMAQDFQKLIGK